MMNSHWLIQDMLNSHWPIQDMLKSYWPIQTGHAELSLATSRHAELSLANAMHDEFWLVSSTIFSSQSQRFHPFSIALFICYSNNIHTRHRLSTSTDQSHQRKSVWYAYLNIKNTLMSHAHMLLAYTYIRSWHMVMFQWIQISEQKVGLFAICKMTLFWTFEVSYRRPHYLLDFN
jgi:hypothetical protein